MNRIDDLALFRAVVDCNGVSAAAVALASSPPAVSRRLAALEERLGVKLVDRGARRFQVTAEGLLFHRRCCAILDQVRDAEAEMSAGAGRLSGRLRVSLPCDFGRRRLAPAIGRFACGHPELDVHVVPSDGGLDPGRDDLDVALRIDRPTDTSLVIRKLAHTPLIVCAAPAYLERRPEPLRPADLAGHDCLRLARRDGLIDAWRLNSGARVETIRVGGSLSSSSGELLRDWTLAGLGVGLEALWDVEEDLNDGRLRRLLPDWNAPRIELYAVWLPGKPVAQRIRTFVDLIASIFSRGAPAS